MNSLNTLLNTTKLLILCNVSDLIIQYTEIKKIQSKILELYIYKGNDNISLLLFFKLFQQSHSFNFNKIVSL